MANNIVRIMLVEDYKLMRVGIKSLFERYPDLEIIKECETAKEAIESAKFIKPDVILMDIGLPDMSGIEAAKKILNDNKKVKNDKKPYYLVENKPKIGKTTLYTLITNNGE